MRDMPTGGAIFIVLELFESRRDKTVHLTGCCPRPGISHLFNRSKHRRALEYQTGTLYILILFFLFFFFCLLLLFFAHVGTISTVALQQRYSSVLCKYMLVSGPKPAGEGAPQRNHNSCNVW